MISQLRHPVTVSVLALVAVASCGILPGDEGLPIEFVNRTGENIVLYEHGRAYPALRKELAPDARRDNVWVGSRLDDKAKDSAIYRVEATTTSGELMFCHVYSFNELTRVRWVVEIRRQNDCPP